MGTVMSQAYYGSQRRTRRFVRRSRLPRDRCWFLAERLLGRCFIPTLGHTAFPQEVWEGNVPYVLGRQEVADEIEGTLGTSHNTYRWQREFTQDQLLDPANCRSWARGSAGSRRCSRRPGSLGSGDGIGPGNGSGESRGHQGQDSPVADHRRYPIAQHSFYYR